ncbi:MAG: hypothetical protein M0Z48_01370 [Nitrospiraceae bacterium]|nr:hypothetical protein [Nitrospiraceae bacterium]
MEENKEGLPSAGDGFKGPLKLPGAGVLFGRSWDLYRKRFQVFSLIYLFYLGPIMLISALCYSVWKTFPHPLNPLVAAWIAMGVLMAVLISLWGQWAFVYAISEPGLAAKALFRKSTQTLKKFTWLYLLFAALTIAGFVLFIVPGLILMVWFSFSFFILAGKGKTGLNALLESREYVRGFWWPVFSRLAAVWLPAYALGYVPGIGPLVSLLFMPLMVAYTYNLYGDLAAMKGAVREPTAGQRKTLAILAAAGVIVTVSAAVYTARHVDLKAIWLEGAGQKAAPAPKLPALMKPSAPKPPALKPNTKN